MITSPSIRRGFLLVADISGYTSYLTRSELEHAQQTLTALLNLLIEHTRPPLVISRLAGDAVISYGLEDNFLQGQTFVEMIDDTYISFRRAIERMVRNTTCPCNACKNIGSLDLKFFIHYAVFGIQKLDAHEELVGSDVIVLHRLLKNHVLEKTGISAYTLYTDQALRQLELGEASVDMVPHAEEYEHLGEVKTWVKDMHLVWDEKKRLTSTTIPPDGVLIQFETTIETTPERLWDYLILPEHFNVLAGGTRTEIERLEKGFVSVGSIYQCYHGDHPISQTILEWEPFERILVIFEVPVPVKGVFMLVEMKIEQSPSGIRFRQIIGKASGPADGVEMANQMFLDMEDQAQIDVDNFGRHVNEDITRRIFQ